MDCAPNRAPVCGKTAEQAPSFRLVPPTLTRQTLSDPRRAPPLVDRNDTRRRIRAPHSETLHVEAEAHRGQGHAKEEALELMIGHRSRNIAPSRSEVSCDLGPMDCLRRRESLPPPAPLPAKKTKASA